MRTRSFCAILTLAVLFAAGGIALPRRIVLANTEYASRWNAKRFSEVSVGDTLDGVLICIGVPLEVEVIGDIGTVSTRHRFGIESVLKSDIGRKKDLVLQYSRTKNKWGDFFHDVELHIRNGKVLGKRDELYHEFW